MKGKINFKKTESTEKSKNKKWFKVNVQIYSKAHQVSQNEWKY